MAMLDDIGRSDRAGKKEKERKEREEREERADIRSQYPKNFKATQTGTNYSPKQLGKMGMVSMGGPAGALMTATKIGSDAYKQYNEMAETVKNDLGLGSIKEAKNYMNDNNITPTKMWGQGGEVKRRDDQVVGAVDSGGDSGTFADYVNEKESEPEIEVGDPRSQNLLERIGKTDINNRGTLVQGEPYLKPTGLLSSLQPANNSMSQNYDEGLRPINITAGGQQISFIPKPNRDWVESKNRMRLGENAQGLESLNANRNYDLGLRNLQSTVDENLRNYNLQQDRNNMLWEQTDEAKRLNDMRNQRDIERIAQGGRDLDLQAEAAEPSVMDYISGGAGLLSSIGSFF